MLVVFALVSWRWHIAIPQGKSNVEKAVAVQSVSVVQRDVPEILTVTGFVTPLNSVDIRPLVTSTVRRVDVKEGRMVQAGQRLFTLDDRGDVANAAKIGAELGKDEALLNEASRTLARNRELVGRGFVSQAAVDSAQSNVDALMATLKSDRAATAGAQVTVGYSAVNSPLSGRVGEIKVHVGSLVQPNNAEAMTTVTQIDPIAIAFNVPERNVQVLLAAERSGGVPVTAHLESSVVVGRLSFIDNAVDETSGSLKVKAEFENHQGLLWSGALVTVDLPLRILKQAIVVPPRAVQVGPNGQFVYRIDTNGMVTSQPVTVDYLTSGLAVVRGTAAGTRVVVEGGQNLRPGMRVTESKTQDAK